MSEVVERLSAGNFTFRLTPDLRAALRRSAKVNGWSMSDEIRHRLTLELKRDRDERCG